MTNYDKIDFYDPAKDRAQRIGLVGLPQRKIEIIETESEFKVVKQPRLDLSDVIRHEK